jgi:hypothetical protein
VVVRRGGGVSYLDRVLPIWAKIVLVSLVVVVPFYLLGYFGIRMIPEDDQFEAVVAFLLLMIFWELQSIRNKL